MRHAVISALVLQLAATTAAIAQSDHGPPPSELAQRCGSQIQWQESFDAAIKRAKEMKRPIFWYLATVPRSPMDRKPVIDMYMRAGPFSAPDVVSAINRRFIALKAPPTKDQAKAYKLAPIEFIEPGFLVLKPDGTEIGRVDKITTFHDLWFVQVLNRIMAGKGELARPSDASEKATAENKPRELLLDGLWSEALRANPVDPYYRGCIQSRLGDAKGARESFAPRRAEGLPELELGLLALREENWADAESHFSKMGGVDEAPREPVIRDPLMQAAYLRGVALCRLNRQPEAQAIWQKLADPKSQSPWAAKAAAEVERYGPFSRGFEEYGYLPPEAMPDQTRDIIGTQRPRTSESADVQLLAKSSVRYLLERQNPDGGWDDSNYDFGGRDSLPDVYTACTALCALALLEWKEIDPERIQAALTRASAYLSDESHVATANTQERVWAHSYRALFFSKLAKAGGPLAELAATKLRDVVKRLQDLQAENGQFAHEYPNPFATATALHALKVAEKAGAPPAAATAIASGVAAMKKSQGDNGAYAYNFGAKGSRDLDMAGGRMPMCELAMLLCGASTEERLADAIKTSRDHHDALERSRKYDDHVPTNHAIGGFFFWYDVYGRCLAIDALGDAAKKRVLFENERKLISGIAEIDGRFVDSHELGKPYGTAMALLSLRLATEKAP
jgi:hypothetical protein